MLLFPSWSYFTEKETRAQEEQVTTVRVFSKEVTYFPGFLTRAWVSVTKYRDTRKGMEQRAQGGRHRESLFPRPSRQVSAHTVTAIL